MRAATDRRSNPMWGPDWRAVASAWTLDPSVTFLNHGSFGATPRPVLAAQDRLRAEMEAEPVEFLWRRLPSLLEAARNDVCAFLDADPDGFAFVANATTAVSTVLAGLDVREGDRLVTTDHAYPAVLNALRRTCERSSAELLVVPVPLPPPPPRDIVGLLDAVLDERVRLVLLDHVTSATATILPVAEVVELCRRRGVPVMIDGAHAPGMLELSLRSLAPDYWTGNFHKWVCSPKGAAGLWVAAAHRERTHPLVTSHGAGRGFRAEFDYTGTGDLTAFLAVPDALGFMGGLGWDRLREHNHALAAYGQRTVAEALGTRPPVPADRFGSMALVAVPDGLAPSAELAAALQARLFEHHRVEVPISWWNGAAFLRLSAQVYNAPGDYDRLAEALRTMR